VLLPELVPEPDAVGGVVGQPIAELVGEHDDLAAMMGFVREHVGKHGRTGGPGARPGAARELGDAALRAGGQRVGEHAQALRAAFLVRRGGLLDGAAAGIERSGTFQVWGGMFQPHQAAVMQVRENRGDGAAAAFCGGKLGAPGAGVEMREEELVHGVVDRVGFKQDFANVG